MGNRTAIFRNCLLLSKLNIMIPVSLSGFMGYLLYRPEFSSGLFLITAAILLMAITASVINQLQEIDTDRKMNRTKNRPLPSGKISPSGAFAFAAFCFLSGSFLFFLAGSYRALSLSILTILWYNGVYTYLKRVTPFAVVPGAITGALPPLIGWVAAGGEPFSISIILVQLLFFIGQLPHFWLLLIKYGDEYGNAGLPSMTSVMSKRSISMLVIAFVAVSAAAAVSLELAGQIHSTRTGLSLLIASAMLVILFFRFREGKDPARYSLLLNVYFLVVMILLISDRIIG